MTDHPLLAPHRAPLGAGGAGTHPDRAGRDIRATDRVISFPHDNSRCIQLVQSCHVLREVAHLAAEVFPPNIGVRQVLLKPFEPQRLLDAVSGAFAEPVQCESGLFVVDKWRLRVPDFKP